MAKKTHFEYALVAGVAQVLYLGQADEWIPDDQPRWTVKKFSWLTAGDGTTQLDTVKVLSGVSWADRASLNWS